MAKNLIERIKEELANAPKRKKPDPRPSPEPIEPMIETSESKMTSEEPECKSLVYNLGKPAKSESGTNISESTVSGVSYDDYHLVLSEEELDKVIERIMTIKEVSIDLETTSPNPIIAQIVGIALSPAPHEAYYIPVGHKSGNTDFQKQLEIEYFIQKLKPIIEDEAISKIGQNLKYEFTILERYGINLRGISHDILN